MVREDYLIILNARNKVQVVHTYLEQIVLSFEIHRITFQLGGKQTEQPVLTIEKGKVKRTTAQQAELEYNSILKKYLDKGYKKVSDFTKEPFDTISEETLRSFLGDKTDQQGIPKPMLAVQSDKVANNVFEREWYCSRKIDGVRCLMYSKDGEIHTASRGGGDYDAATVKLRKNPTLIELFNRNPELILDGELYYHGKSLQTISGIVRLKEWEEKCDILEYWIYDYVSDKPFEYRYNELMKMQKLFGNESSDNKIKVIDHYLISGWFNIKAKHDDFVKEGFEGLVMRSPTKEYGIGKRSSVYMIKLKQHNDGEFPIVGYEEGLRPEDMVFVCKANNGETFKAKPVGPRELKYEYLDNMNSIIGKTATVKYFYESDSGTPLQPVLKAIRDYE